MRDSVGIELLGTPAVALVTEPFEDTARETASTAGLESFPIVVLSHPLGMLPGDVIRARLSGLLDQIIAGITQATDGASQRPSSRIYGPEPEFVRITGRSNTEALLEVNRHFHENRWTDGFPIIPPTEEALRLMLSGTDRNPDEVLGAVPPANGRATIRNIAINSILAGADPEHLPVILAAVEALLDPRFGTGQQNWGLHGLQTSTAAVAPLTIVNGPLARELQIESRRGPFSQGRRANVAIGRAVRMVLTNIGGVRPGINDMRAQGSSQEFTFCCAEREDHSAYVQGPKPWRPLHVERGFAYESSTVTVAAAWMPIHIADREDCGPKILDRVAASLSDLAVVPFTPDRECFLILGATHARCLAGAGMSKDDVREYLYANTRMPWRLYREQYPGPGALQPRWMRYINDDSATVQIYKGPENFQIIVAGEECHYSQVVRVSYRSVTKEIGLRRS